MKLSSKIRTICFVLKPKKVREMVTVSEYQITFGRARGERNGVDG